MDGSDCNYKRKYFKDWRSFDLNREHKSIARDILLKFSLPKSKPFLHSDPLIKHLLDFLITSHNSVSTLIITMTFIKFTGKRFAD